MDENSADSSEWSVFVLTEYSLQKWLVSRVELGKLVFEWDVIVQIRQAFFDALWVSFYFSDMVFILVDHN